MTSIDLVIWLLAFAVYIPAWASDKDSCGASFSRGSVVRPEGATGEHLMEVAAIQKLIEWITEAKDNKKVLSIRGRDFDFEVRDLLFLFQNLPAHEFTTDYRRLDIDFNAAQADLYYKKANSKKLQVIQISFRSYKKSFSSRLLDYLRRVLNDLEEEAKSLAGWSKSKLVQFWRSQKKDVIIRPGGAQSLLPSSTLFHITNSRETMTKILESGIEMGTGNVGDAVYAVTSEYLADNIRWMNQSHWTNGRAKNLVIEIRMKRSTKFLDIYSEIGQRAFEAYRRAKVPQGEDLDHFGLVSDLMDYVEELGVDGVIYDWAEGGVPAIAIYNLKAIGAISHHKAQSI